MISPLGPKKQTKPNGRVWARWAGHEPTFTSRLLPPPVLIDLLPSTICAYRSYSSVQTREQFGSLASWYGNCERQFQKHVGRPQDVAWKNSISNARAHVIAQSCNFIVGAVF